MAIARKPKPSNASSKKSEVDVDALINKGGSVAQTVIKTEQAEQFAQEPIEVSPNPQPETTLKLIDTEKLQVQQSKPIEDKQEIRVNLRMPADMLEQVDKAVKSRPLKIPRHTWLLEAVMEKLAREEKAN